MSVANLSMGRAFFLGGDKVFLVYVLSTDPAKKSKTYHLLQLIKNLQPNYFY